MIELVVVDNFKVEQLEKTFPQIWNNKSVKSTLIDNPFAHIFTYSINSQVVGFIHYDILYERSELIQINVINEFQNQKIASRLIEYMILDCKKNNIANITLEVRKDNIVAIHLYEKYGFKKVAIRKGYYQGIDGILMEKELM